VVPAGHRLGHRSAARSLDDFAGRSRLGSALQVVVEKLVQFGICHDAREAVELTVVRDLPGRLDESMHGDPRHCAADADAAHAERGEIIDGVTERTVIEKVDRLRADGLNRSRYLF